MTISDADIKLRYSVVAMQGDTEEGFAATSLGDRVSTTEVDPDKVSNNIFVDIDGNEAADGAIAYRCIFVVNESATDTLKDAKVEITANTQGGADLRVAVDQTPVSALSRMGQPQAGAIPNESSNPPTAGEFGFGPFSLGDIGPAECKGIWLRRITPTGVGPVNPDAATITVTGRTL